MKRKVTKAVITCGGYATRFLPIAKSVPKEMLPIWDKPVIHYIMQELVDAGITDVLILVGRGREILQNYFDRNYEIDDYMGTANALKLNPFEGKVNIYYRRVPMPRGAADNILHAKAWVGNEPFIVAYSDDVFFEGNPSAELIREYTKHGRVSLSACEVPPESAHNYGVIFKNKIIEKPKKPMSNYIACGRYLMKPEVFEEIEKQSVASATQVCMVKCLNHLDFRAVKTGAKRFDVGVPSGLFLANLYYSQDVQGKRV